MLKNDKGISLVTMVMTVLIMAIILSTLTYTAYSNLKIRGLNKLYNDIRTLNDKVAVYYMENGTLPVSGEYKTITVGYELDETIKFVTKDGTFTNQDSLVNPNDYNDESGTGQATYSLINLGLLDNITLENTGNYIINDQSHTIYYADGVAIDGETYYTIPLDYKDTEYNIKHPIGKMYAKAVYLPMGGTSLNLKDYINFKTSDGKTDAVPKSVTYEISTSGYGDYFTLENGIITSKSVAPSSDSYYIKATATSYGTTTTTSTTLTVRLTDLTLYNVTESTDTVAQAEVTSLNLLKGSETTIYAKKLGNAGTFKLLSEVQSGDGITASVDNGSSSSTTVPIVVGTESYYPVAIKATNAGKVILKVVEQNGKATKTVNINVFDPSLNKTSTSFTSSTDKQELELNLGDIYTENPSRFTVNWTSGDTGIATVTPNSTDKLKATVTPSGTGFGVASVYCEILVDGTALTTLECKVTSTGILITNSQMNVGDETALTYKIGDGIATLSIPETTLSSADTTILEVSGTSLDTYKFSAVKAGTSEVTLTIKLSDGTTYTDKRNITVSETATGT